MPSPFLGNIATNPAQEAQRQRALAQAFLARALRGSGGRTGQDRLFSGLQSLSSGIVGGLLNSRAGRSEQRALSQQRQADAQELQALQSLFGGAPNETQGLASVGSGVTVPGVPEGLINSESGGNFQARNNAQGSGGRGHFGRLQFSQGRLSEASKALGVNITPEGFLNNPELQQRVERWHFADIDNFARRSGIAEKFGQTIGGVPLTPDAFRAMAHLGGKGGARRFVETGGRHNPADANGTTLRDYGLRFSGSPGQSFEEQVRTGNFTGAPTDGTFNPANIPPQPNEFFRRINAAPNIAPTSAPPQPNAPALSGDQLLENLVNQPIPVVTPPTANQELPIVPGPSPLTNVELPIRARGLRAADEFFQGPGFVDPANPLRNLITQQAGGTAPVPPVSVSPLTPQAPVSGSATPQAPVGAPAAPQASSNVLPSIQRLLRTLPFVTGQNRALVLRMIQEQMKQAGPTKGVVAGDRLINPITGQVISDLRPEFDTVTAADGFQYKVFRDGRPPERLIPGAERLDPNVRSPEAQRQAIERARAGKTEIDLGAAEKEFDKKFGGKLGERAFELQEAATQARGKIANLDALRSSLAAAPTGRGAETVLAVKQALSFLGVDVGDLSDSELAQSLGNQLALQLRNPSGGAGMPGAMSDKDREFLKQSIPNLQKTPAGNGKLAELLIKVEQRSIEVARLAREYMQANNGRLDVGFFGVVDQFAAENQLFGQEDAAPTQKKRLKFNPETGELE